MQSITEQNKKTVIRFNKEFIEKGDRETFEELVATDVVNHSAPLGSSTGADGMIHFLQDILRAGFPDLTVEILDQVAEGDLVTTRKAIQATHTGSFMGVPPTGKRVVIKVIDMIRLKDGKYVEHWGMSNIPEVIAQLSIS
ncbi:MAG TPA: ester cyclase [Bacteroidia bacterium]|nr:ester cyclase [Bacteroidia bacterium]